MKRDITEEITRAAYVSSDLKKMEKLMKYKDKELYRHKKDKEKER